jgi:hypothetical protein
MADINIKIAGQTHTTFANGLNHSGEITGRPSVVFEPLS